MAEVATLSWAWDVLLQFPVNFQSMRIIEHSKKKIAPVSTQMCWSRILILFSHILSTFTLLFVVRRICLSQFENKSIKKISGSLPKTRHI